MAGLVGERVAFVVLREGLEPSAEDLTSFLRARIAAYKLPSRIHFLDALPLTASGKIAHHDLIISIYIVTMIAFITVITKLFPFAWVSAPPARRSTPR
jgi:non-ribosomal peptide synthetase component E (peptide arylation enzyme)